MAGFNRDIGASLFLLGIGLAICFLSLQYDLGTPASPGPGFMGLCCGSVVSLLSVLGFLISWGRTKAGKAIFGSLWLHSLIILLLLCGFALLLNSLGFLVCTFLFMFVLLTKAKIYSWFAVWAWSLGTAVVLYLVFQVWLQAQLPMGLLRYIGL